MLSDLALLSSCVFECCQAWRCCLAVYGVVWLWCPLTLTDKYVAWRCCLAGSGVVWLGVVVWLGGVYLSIAVWLSVVVWLGGICLGIVV